MGNSSSSYADIRDVKTTGASAKTAKQDKLKCKGVEVSHIMAKTDAGGMKKYREKIKKVGLEYGIDPALIAAIISRESRAGKTIKDNDGWGDYDRETGAFNAWGLMQVDVNPNGGGHKPLGAWESEEHLCQATGILVDFIDKISRKFPDWCPAQKLKGLFYRISRFTLCKAVFSFVFLCAGGIAAYNMGDGNVYSYDKVDEYTTGGDYSNDVVARAQWYKKYGDF
ncbi:lysozyme g-like isoform X1 [Channa argus]|uniref:lysozyme g-like isoform X1 n=1 Tax=Channa argus TaxID=215402 RepID=UPI00351FC7AB